MSKREQRNLGFYVLGQRGTACKRLTGHLLTLQDHLTGIPLMASDPPAKTLTELVKEVLTDATKKKKETSQPTA